MIETRISLGRWIRIHSGVYGLAGTPPSWRRALMAACLAYGGCAFVSHRAAAALWALPGFVEGQIELTVPRERGRIEGITVHRVASLTKADVTMIGGLPVTTATRTLIDVAAFASDSSVEEALDDALRRGLVTIPRLRRRLLELRSKGRARIGLVGALLDARDNGGVPRSVFETKLLKLLCEQGLPNPVLQHEVFDRGRLVAVLDFAYTEVLVAVEADGRRWHTGHRWVRDLTRRNALTALGWRLVHVTWEDLMIRPTQTASLIVEVLGQAARRSRT